MKALDRAFGCLMVLGAFGHGLGSYRAYASQPMTLLWALSASFAGLLLAAVNLLRAGRKGDRALAWISFFGCIVWIGFVVCFGLLIRNMFDFRPLVNLVITAALAIFSLRSALKRES
jgi:hypothetical protein